MSQKEIAFAFLGRVFVSVLFASFIWFVLSAFGVHGFIAGFLSAFFPTIYFTATLAN